MKPSRILLGLLSFGFLAPQVTAFTSAHPSARVSASISWGLGPFIRVDGANPVLSPGSSHFMDPMTGKDTAWEAANVFNPAAVVRGDSVYLLYRAEDASGDEIGMHTSRIGLAKSTDGKSFKRRPQPVLYPRNDAQKAFDWPGGCEDPRVVETPDGGYLLTYTAWNRKVATLSVATSRDLVHWTKKGPAFARAGNRRYVGLWSKSASIVCRRVGDHLVATKIGGKYRMYWGDTSIYAATSDNLIDWKPVTDAKGSLLPVLKTRRGKWDSQLVEPGPPAIVTPAGILLLYNARNAGTDGDPHVREGTYSAGQALFDAGNPSRLIARRDDFFLTPEKPYELSGQYKAGTVFIEGLVHFKNRWWLYYGTADSHIAVARTAG